MLRFDHEKLNVDQTAIRNVAWVTELLDRVPKSIAVHNQLDRASTSIPLNIAEGNGKFTAADRCRFLTSLVVLHWSVPLVWMY
jgi:four helix bundle protein